ncbi:Cilia- and flagella-associated protein 52 [Desmophyllum pertusum]|uniref:Cilia- and flagella-associated protein 52 n=1 Tax=Desmophyllum pertusum TaxID=174260 RepID=A0A9W9ZYH5_9CNID|nr:Cilia- and flagella-associated protein 52 [Desmophyllum pertusum]
MGFQADVIVWDFEKGTIRHTLDPLHKVKVEALAFSPNDLYLVSLGGQDDRAIVVWDVKTGSAICGSTAGAPSAGTTYAVAYASLSDEMFCHCNTLRVWELDVENRKIRPHEVSMGQLKRTVKCIQMSNDDTHFYCGTTTGDILEINVKNKLMTDYGPKDSERLSLGVNAIRILMTGDVLVGAGDGTVAIIKIAKGKYKKTQSVKVDGGITSIALRGQGHQFFVGTKNSQMYLFSYSTFEQYVRIKTCHYSPINDVIFPHGSSELFLTCAKSEIRIWSTKTNQEVVRIAVANMTCNAIDIMRCGTRIISGWDDGKIRAFTPETAACCMK